MKKRPLIIMRIDVGALAVIITAVALFGSPWGLPALTAERSYLEPADVNWWGIYESDKYTLGITNYNGAGFRFTFSDATGDVESSSAGLDSTNPRLAQFGDIVFEFDGEDTISVTKYDGDADVYVTGGDYTGTYIRP